MKNLIPHNIDSHNISNGALARSYRLVSYLHEGQIAIYEKTDGSGYESGFVLPSGLSTIISIKYRNIDSKRQVYMVLSSPHRKELCREIYTFMQTRLDWEYDFADYNPFLVKKVVDKQDE